VLVLAIVRRFGPSWTAAGYAAFACALVALTFIDLDTWLLPHEITWPLLAAGLASPIWNPALRPLDSLVGAAAGFAFFAAIALFGEKVLRRETMGWGDVWLLAGIGAWLGWQQLLPVVLLAALQGSAAGLLMIALKRRKREVAAEASTTREGSPPSPSESVTPSVRATPDRSRGLDERPDLAPPPVSTIPPPPEAAAELDWVPPAHAVPFGPFLALAALEQLLIGERLARAYADFLGGLWR
jgi:leader peptidase (prepilin peptidase)/N-methyltransferase